MNITDTKQVHALRKEASSLGAGTPMYSAPEQSSESIYLTDKADMFAAGLILYELCSHFKTQHQRTQKFKSLKENRKLADLSSMPEERDIILNLTDPDPQKRSSAAYLLDSSTFKKWTFDVKQ